MSCFGDNFLFFFSSRRRHTRFDCDWSQTCALPIFLEALDVAVGVALVGRVLGILVPEFGLLALGFILRHGERRAIGAGVGRRLQGIGLVILRLHPLQDIVLRFLEDVSVARRRLEAG